MTAPLAIDEQAVWRYLHGDRTIRLHSKERILAIRQLLAAGVPPNHVAQRIGCSLQYVCQIRDGKRGWKVPHAVLPTPEPHPADELDGGRWVKGPGGVAKWVTT